MATVSFNPGGDPNVNVKAATDPSFTTINGYGTSPNVNVTSGTKEDLAKANAQAANASGEGIILTPPPGTRLHTIRPRYDLVKKNLRGSLSAFRIKNSGITRRYVTGEVEKLYKMFKDPEDSQDTASSGYTQFLLQGTSLVFQEKAQVITTAGDNDVVYYFGRTPTQLTIQGTLIDDADNDWFTGFVTAYNSIMRGTQLARNFEVIELSTPSVNYVGTIMNLQLGQSSQVEQLVPFSMTLLLKEVTPLSVTAWGEEVNQTKDGFESVKWAGYDQMSDVARNQYILPEEVFSYYDYRGEGKAFLDHKIFSEVPVEKPEHLFSSEYVSVASGVRTSILDSIESINSAILTTASVGANLITDISNFVTAPLDLIEGVANGVTSIINAAEAANDQLADALLAPYNQLLATEDSLKGMVGTITAFPETISETLARMTGDNSYGTATFAGGKSLSSEDAMAILRDANHRDPSKVPVVGPPSTADSSSDDGASISF
jgi:hypothetical protein